MLRHLQPKAFASGQLSLSKQPGPSVLNLAFLAFLKLFGFRLSLWRLYKEGTAPSVRQHRHESNERNSNEQQQRQQLHQRLDQHQCVLHQLPVHPRQWNMLAATCSECVTPWTVDARRCGMSFAYRPCNQGFEPHDGREANPQSSL